MSTSAKIGFTKSWLSLADQIARLEGRGLIVADRTAAETFLSHLNYFRFSGYCLAFEVQRHEFIRGQLSRTSSPLMSSIWHYVTY